MSNQHGSLQSRLPEHRQSSTSTSPHREDLKSRACAWIGLIGSLLVTLLGVSALTISIHIYARATLVQVCYI